MNRYTRYQDRLRNFPAPKQGRHRALLGVANLGVQAGLTAENIRADIIQTAGSPPLSSREINEAIRKALQDYARRDGLAGFRPRPAPRPTFDGEATRRRIVEGSPAPDEADIWECSPIRIDWLPEEDVSVFIEKLFDPEELLFIGRREELGALDKTIHQAASWTKFFRGGGTSGPLVCVNPLTGRPAPKKSGEGETLRGDGCVAAFRYVLVEFDSIPRIEQIAFLGAFPLPIRALVCSGNKSIHAWVDVEALNGGPVRSLEEWDRLVRGELFARRLVPLGVDRACANPARLARLPGVRRAETRRMQKLLWLSPAAREVFYGRKT